MTAVAIQYNIVEAHYKIAELEEALAKAEAQSDMYLEGLRDYAESDYWRQDNPGKNLENYVNDAERDYTLE